MSHYKPYPAYKDSGVEWLGKVPEHWAVKRLRFVASINPAIRPEILETPTAEVSFIPMEDIGEDGSLNLEKTRAVQDVKNGYSYFENGDVAFAKVTPCFENGKGALMHDLVGGVGFGTTELTVLRSSNGCKATFLNYLVQSNRFRCFGAGAMTGAGGLKRVPDEFTRNFATSWPSLAEQQVIANHLDRETTRLDALVNKKTRFMELLREKRQALITHAVTKGLDPSIKMKDSGVEWLGEIPKHWEAKLIKYVSLHIGSGKTPSGGAEVYQNSGVIFLRSQNVHDDGLRLDDVAFISTEIDAEMQNSRVKINDVLLNITGASIGRSCIVSQEIGPANVNQHVCIIRTKNSHQARWISACLLSQPIKSQIDFWQNGAGREGLNFEQIGNMAIALPPASEQKAVNAHLTRETTRIDTLIQKNQHSIDLLKERRAALITAAVTGQIDLREAA